MTRKAIQTALTQKPFQPFSVRLTHGELVRLRGAHNAAVHPKGKTMVIFEDDGGYRILDLVLITELQTV